MTSLERRECRDRRKEEEMVEMEAGSTRTRCLNSSSNNSNKEVEVEGSSIPLTSEVIPEVVEVCLRTSLKPSGEVSAASVEAGQASIDNNNSNNR